MLRLLLGRIWQTFIVVLIVAIIVFVLMRLVPGDPIQIMFGEESFTEAQRDAIRAEYGFDKPLVVQFLLFFFNLFRGDLGVSLYYKAPVAELVAPAVLATVELTLAATIVAIIVGTPIAIISALQQGKAVDKAGSAVALFGISMPSFWLGILLILVFSVHLGMFPTGGRTGVPVPNVTGLILLDSIIAGNPDAIKSSLMHLALPSITLGAAVAATLVRVLRAGLIEVKQMDFVDALSARGVSRGPILRHMMQNALPPTIIMMGIRIGSLLGGAIVIEVIFSWPGLGRLIVDAISARDYPLVQGGVVVMAILFVAVNLIVDIVHGAMDPRIRHSKKVG